MPTRREHSWNLYPVDEMDNRATQVWPCLHAPVAALRSVPGGPPARNARHGRGTDRDAGRGLDNRRLTESVLLLRPGGLAFRGADAAGHAATGLRGRMPT